MRGVRSHLTWFLPNFLVNHISGHHLQTSVGMLDGVDVDSCFILVNFVMVEFCIFTSFLDATFLGLLFLEYFLF